MGAITWVVRVLLLLVVARFVLRLLFGQKGRPGAGPRRVERPGGTLVRDPNCGTYIPRDRALTARSGSATLYFCSAACRDAHLGEHVPDARTG